MKKLLLAVLALALLAAPQLLSAQSAQASQTLTSASYESLPKDTISIILFSANYCPACKRAKANFLPILVNKYKQEERVQVFVLDTGKDTPNSQGQYLNQLWGISKLPTFVVVYNDTVMFSKVGYLAEKQAQLEQEIDKQIAKLK